MSEAVVAEFRNKLDKILNSVDNLKTRLDNLDIALMKESYDKRLNVLILG